MNDEGMGFGRRELIDNIILHNWKDGKIVFNKNELLFVIQEMLEEEGKAYLTHRGKVGSPFKVFNEFAKYLLYRNLGNYDSMVLMSGTKGTGKSSAAIMLARAWCRLLGIQFNPKRHIAYNNADVMNKIDTLNKFEPLIADESVNFAASVDWAKKENKQLRKKLAQVRTKHLLYILCFPLKIQKLEKNYLESFVNYWCLTGDTKITTRDINGMIRRTPLKDLNKHNPEVLTYNLETKKYEFKKYNKKVKTKKNVEVFEVELENGLKIKATEDHLFLTQRGYVKLKDLKDDDEIEVNTKKCKYCNKDFIPKKESQVSCDIKCKKRGEFFRNKPQAKLIRNEWWERNVERVKKEGKEKRKANIESYHKKEQEYREKNKDRINEYMAKFREENREYLRKYGKELRLSKHEYCLMKERAKHKRYMKIPSKKISYNLRKHLYSVLKGKKKKGIEKYIGCSIKEFKIYIESKFKDWMSWDNWGLYTWHLDHIKPCCMFDLTKEENIYKCFNYTNYQPLKASDNWSKGGRYVG